MILLKKQYNDYKNNKLETFNDDTLWSYYNWVTEILKTSNIRYTLNKHINLTKVIHWYINLLDERKKKSDKK